MKKVIYIIENFPSPTEYFILNEILQLEKKGLEPTIVVLNKQRKYLKLPELADLKSQIFYVPKIYRFIPFWSFFKEPILFIKFLKLPFLDTCKRPFKKARDYCISIYVLSKLKGNQKLHFHAHFAFLATDIAIILAKIRGTEFSVTMHAQDIYTNREKLENIISDCSFLITCTQYNMNYLNKLTNCKYEKKIYKVYHGINTSHWIVPKKYSQSSSQINIISIARLVEKKGLKYLLQAMLILIKEGYNIKCVIIGEGELKESLMKYISIHNMQDNVEILEYQPQEKIKQFLTDSDIFILPSIIAQSGDRDGLPNVIVEAMILGLPVISTKISAIPEIIDNRHTGLLVKDKNADAITIAVKELINNKKLYGQIVDNSKKLIKSKLEIQQCTDTLISIFQNNL